MSSASSHDVLDPKRLGEYVEVAVDAAWRAGRRTLAYFNTGVAAEAKQDGTPVTIADREAEQLIRTCLSQRYPTHSILGEEHGSADGDSEHRWIIDPIDGTKSFVRGVPLYGTLLALEVRKRMVLGVVYMPALDEMIWAADGMGCWWNGRRARVSSTSSLAEACVSCTSPVRASARSDAWHRLASQAQVARGWGDCYGHILVATGRIEAMVDAAISPWDCAPLLPILREAGGHFTTWENEPTIWGPDAVSTNAALHNQVLAILRSEKPARA